MPSPPFGSYDIDRRTAAVLGAAQDRESRRSQIWHERRPRPTSLTKRSSRQRTKATATILMASHGRTGIKRLLLESETQKLLVHLRIPVLVYR